MQETLDQLLQGFLRWPNGPVGCACLCAQKGLPLYEGCFGYADKEILRPITPDTPCRIMSMTKVIVCAAAMMLFERGQFLMDDPIARYFPEYAHQRRMERPNELSATVPVEHPMTVANAFTMTCGLPYDISGHALSPLMAAREAELARAVGWNYDIESEVRAMADVPLAWEPGTHWMYGYGHDILSGLIQLISGMPTHEFLQKEIFDPLGMKDTAYRFRADHRERLCTIYRAEPNGERVPCEGPRDRYHEPDANYDMGGAGLYSTPRDYLAFTQMLANGGVAPDGRRLLGATTIDLWRTNQLEGEALADFRAAGANASYGYGYGVRTRMPGPGDNNAPVGEFGWCGMCGTWSSIDPSTGFSCVYMHQLLPDLDETCHPRVRSVVYGKHEAAYQALTKNCAERANRI